MSIEAMKAMANYIDVLGGNSKKYRQAIAEAEKQEPVAWRYKAVSPFVGKDGTYKVMDEWTLIRKPEQRDSHSAMCGMEAEPLYPHPQPKREWVDLTDDECLVIIDQWHWDEGKTNYLCRLIEAKLKQKNGHAEEKNT